MEKKIGKSGKVRKCRKLKKITKNDISAVLDYGNGDKDAKATLTIHGVTKEISLRK